MEVSSVTKSKLVISFPVLNVRHGCSKGFLVFFIVVQILTKKRDSCPIWLPNGYLTFKDNALAQHNITRLSKDDINASFVNCLASHSYHAYKPSLSKTVCCFLSGIRFL